MNPNIPITYKKIPVAQNFLMYEFFYPDFSAWYKTFAKSFDLSSSLINAAQVIRTFFGQPVYISSVYRPKDTYGFHRYAMALDLHFGTNLVLLTKLKQILNDHKNNPTLFKSLRETGITGFGLESNHLHLDIRQFCFNYTDHIGQYQLFEI
jgi:hypothetical protein